MTSLRCRKYGENVVERVVEVGDPDMAPDVFVHNHFDRMPVGAVAFVEVSPLATAEWELWRVECIVEGRGYVTVRVTREDADAEIGRARRSAS